MNDYEDDGASINFSFKHLLCTLWQNVYTLFKLNLCTILFCIPVITIAPAFVALHAGCVDLIRGKKVEVLHLYVETVRRDFSSSWKVLLAVGGSLVFCLVVAAFYFSGILKHRLFLLPGFFFSALAMSALLMLPLALTMQAKLTLKVRDILKNAFLLSYLNFRFSFCATMLSLLIIFLSLWYYLYLLPLTVTFSIALCSFIGSYFSLYTIQQFILPEKL